MNDILPILKALADGTRFRIIDLLLTHDLCVGALANRLGISKPAVSQHLQILRKAGLVRGEKRGYYTHYAIEKDLLLRIADEIKTRFDPAPSPQEVCQRSVSGSTLLFNERRNIDMCNDCCQRPEQLKGKPEECSPEQIKACHGDAGEHPCEKGKPPDDDHR